MDRGQLLRTVGWRLSGHARAAATRRGFHLADVLLAAANPEVAYTQEHRGAGRAVHQRDDIAVVVDRANRTVITVLLRSQVPWTDVDCVQGGLGKSSRSPTGRQPVGRPRGREPGRAAADDRALARQ